MMTLMDSMAQLDKNELFEVMKWRIARAALFSDDPGGEITHRELEVLAWIEAHCAVAMHALRELRLRVESEQVSK